MKRGGYQIKKNCMFCGDPQRERGQLADHSQATLLSRILHGIRCLGHAQIFQMSRRPRRISVAEDVNMCFVVFAS